MSKLFGCAIEVEKQPGLLKWAWRLVGGGGSDMLGGYRVSKFRLWGYGIVNSPVLRVLYLGVSLEMLFYLV